MQNKRKYFFMIPLFLLVLLMTNCNNVKKDVLPMKQTYDIYIVTPAVAKSLYPTGYDVDIAKEKGLIEQSIYEEKYLLLQSCYRTLLNCYLVDSIKLNEYQNRIDSCDYSYPRSSSAKYADFASFGRKNISLRNTLFVERLSKNDIDMIFQSIQDDKIVVTDELIDMVKTTWKDIILVKYESSYDGTPYKIVYDETGINKKDAYNDSLVFEISYNTDYDEKGDSISEEKQKYEYMMSFVDKMEAEISNNLSCHVAVIIN